MASSNQYRVIHQPQVAVRKSPSVNADPVGRKQFGDIVRAARVLDGWLELEGSQGWMLIDGSQVNLGRLLEKVEFEVTSASTATPQVLSQTPSPSESLVVAHAAEYRVVHVPKVAVRKAPSAKAAIVDTKNAGTIVRAAGVKDGWIELENGRGWMLIDGKDVNLGILLEEIRHDSLLTLKVMNPLILGKQLCILEVAEDWTVQKTIELCAEKTGLKKSSMICAKGKMGERVSEGAHLRGEWTLFQAGFHNGDEFAFIYTGNLEKDLKVADESQTFSYTKGDQDTVATAWLRCLMKNPGHRARVVLFSWTGNRGGQGSAHNFQRGGWPTMYPEYELYEVNWPGRGSRMKDPLATDAQELAQQCSTAIWKALEHGRPFAFLGVAFGSILAYEVARRIQAQAPGNGPICLMVVSSEGPGWEGRATALHKLSATAFEDMLQTKGGTDFILNDESMKKQYLPVIKADLQLEETYTWKHAPLLRCPVLVVRGKRPGQDKEQSAVSEQAAALWLKVSTCKVAGRLISLETDWYVLQDAAGCQAIADALMEVIDPKL